LTPFVKVKAFAAGALDPPTWVWGRFGRAQGAEDRRMSLQDVDMIELNEASPPGHRLHAELGLPNDRPNELGSGISLGIRSAPPAHGRW